MKLSEDAEYSSTLQRLMSVSPSLSRRRPEPARAGDGAGHAFRDPGDAVALLCAPPSPGGGGGEGAPQGKRRGPDAGGSPVEACLRDPAAGDLFCSVRRCDGAGLAPCLAESCLAGGRGALLTLDGLDAMHEPHGLLFDEGCDWVVVSLPKERLGDLDALAARHGVMLHYLGMVGGDRLVLSNCHRVLVDIRVAEMETG